MIRKYLLPMLAAAGLAFAVYSVVSGAKAVPPAKAASEPALTPFENTIAGAGIVEARSQNIAVGTPVSGIVSELYVQVGSLVKAGDKLFKIDDRDRVAELAVRNSALASARAELSRLESMPRAEDVPPAQALVAAAESDLADTQNQLALAESLTDKRALAAQEMDRRKFAVLSAGARLAQFKAELAKLEAGAWKPDIEVARAQVDSARAKVEAQEIEIERLTVRAPVDGTVLQVNIRLGEYAPSGVLALPLMMMGDIERLYVRVDIDENDAWRFEPGAKAEAYVRGNRDLKTELTFVRVEPFVIPKRSLTGESTERVDTRVLQVLFSFDPSRLHVYVGQQMDVFIAAAARHPDAQAPAQPKEKR
jgi:multidrug resistance efflux pump